ncbi:unnamed protein product [Phytophthora lilii]|uniref:Unnamed protein product n=1 Tax=Phytophthora lilii TaxID=2077276 RepID=A0A9W6TXY3_9STRA|nr:unnamed protein product [Phytophthora lilii]
MCLGIAVSESMIYVEVFALFYREISPSWNSNTTSVDEIEAYQVYVNEQLADTIGAGSSQYDLYGLSSNTAYSFQVEAIFANGSSSPSLYSNVISISTSDCTVPGTPNSLEKLAVTGGSMRVSVEPPKDTGGANLVNVTVHVRRRDDLSLVTEQSQSAPNSSSLRYSIYGLDAQTSYQVSAFAVNGGGFVSEESNYLVFTTKALQLPDPCPAPTVVSSTGEIKFVCGGRIQGYNVYLATDEGGSFTEVATTINTETVNIVEILRLSELDDEPLLPESRYIFKAVAINLVDVCISVVSSLQLANATDAWTTAAAIPGPPLSPYFLKATGGMITMRLTKSLNMQGAQLTGFLITIDSNNGMVFTHTIATGDDTTYDATSLEASSTYVIRAAVITNLGNSSYSTATAMNTTAPTNPTAPQDVSVSNITGSSAIVEWSSPFDSGGADITGSQEERPAFLSPTTLNNLVATTIYTVKITATNLAGKKSSRSVGTTFKTQPPTIPSEPWNVSLVFASGGAIEVTWNPPTYRGGELLSSMGYTVDAYSSSPCFNNDSLDTCRGCNFVKISLERYQLVENVSVCERPTTQCLDGTYDCCLTRKGSEFGSGLVCGHMEPVQKTIATIGTTSAVFNSLNYSSTYYFGVQASNRAGKSGTSGLQRFRTTDCGELTANTIYEYGVSAVNASLVQGAIASTKLSTESISSPLPPSLSLLEQTYNRLLVSVTQPCDTGGEVPLAYEYMVKDSGNVIASSVFNCCNFTVDELEANRSYTLLARVKNSLISSTWAEVTYSTTSGVPVSPLISLLQANTFSAVITLGSSPYDKEIGSYELYLRQNAIVLQNPIVVCQKEDGIISQYVCPTIYQFKTLEPETHYEISGRAYGPLGSSVLKLVSFTTDAISAGTFGMELTEYNADKDGIIRTVVLRSNGTSGDVVVGVDVEDTVEVRLRCIRVDGGCHCTLYLTSSGVVSEPCSMTFMDGQESNNISFSMLNDDSAELLPPAIVVAPFGVALSNQHAALLNTNARQQPGFISFCVGTTDVQEDASFVMVNVVRLNGTTGKISFNFETFDISAIAGDDYIIANGSSILADQQRATQIWVQLIDNHFINVDKSFGLRLTGQNLPTRADALVTHKVVIRDDESILNAVPNRMDKATIIYTTGGEFGIGLTTSLYTAPVLGYMVRVTAAIAGKVANLYNTTLSTFVLSGLSPMSTYRVAVAAWNLFGLGEYSDDVEVVTKGVTPPSPPQLLTSSAVTSTKFTLAWYTPRDDGGSAIAGYNVMIENIEGGFAKSVEIAMSDLFVVVEGLNASSEYLCHVFSSSAVFLENFKEESSAQISVLTATGAIPRPPPAVTLVGQPRGGTLTLAMTRPVDTGGMPLTYGKVYLRKMTETGSNAETSFSLVCENDLTKQANGICTVNNLLADTSYEGESAPGMREVFITSSAIDLPTSPLNLRPSYITAGNIRLEWDIPSDLGGSSYVVGYLVYQKHDVYGSTYFTLYDGQDSTQRSVTIKGLARESMYAFAVVALNEASFCVDPDLYMLSPFLNVTTLSYSRLSPPTQLYLVSKTGGAITIGWSVPDDLAGVPLQGYIVESVNPSSTEFAMLSSLSSATTTYTQYGLAESTDYSYVVTAVNQDGPSEKSAIFTETTSAVSQPNIVQNFNYVSLSGGSIKLYWDPPQDTGGKQIERYEITRDGRSGNYFVTTTTFEDRSGLDASTYYRYSVTAFNGLYKGYTQSLWATTGSPSLPDPPNLNTIPFGGRLDVSWMAPEYTGGIPINEYVITLTNADGLIVIDGTTSSSLSYTFRNLLANTAYKLSGKSVNDVGMSTVLEFDVETGPPDTPNAPPQPVANNIRGGSIDIHVEDTDYSGGEDITRILYMDGKVVHTFAIGERDTTIYGLIAHTEYGFSVSAKNTAGESKSSALKVSTSTISTPGQVQNLRQVSVSFSQMLLTWDEVEDTGGDMYLEYNVLYVKCSSDGTPQEDEKMQNTDTNTVLVVALQYSSWYSVTVVATTSTSLHGSPSTSILVATEQPLGGVVVAALPEISVQEDAGIVSVRIDRVNGSYGNVSYFFTTQDGNALNEVNYYFTSGNRTLTTNVLSDFVEIPVLSDTEYNPGISFSVVITDFNTGLQTSTHVELTDDGDAGSITFVQSSLNVLENSGIAFLEIARIDGSSPRAMISIITDRDASSVNRFNLADSVVTFEEGVTLQTVSVDVFDDLDFQYVADSITIGFKIIEGGVQYGPTSTITVTAIDNGDLSLPKQCLGLQQTSVTGGALGLRWSPPLDHGGADIPLTYLISIMSGTQVVTEQPCTTETAIVYGLKMSTTYKVSVQAVNSLGPGPASPSLLLTTSAATPPTAPLNIQILSASSASVLVSWDAPLDDGGSVIVAYTIFKISGTTRSLFSSIECSVPTICSIRQLLALTTYSIQIQASSAFVTQGKFSDVIVFNTSSPDYPDAPPIPTITWVSAGAMTISMFDPVNVGGSSIQEYRLYIRADDSLDFMSVYGGSSREHTVYRLRYQTVYHIKYQVVNSVGPSAYSPIKTNQTLSKSLPSAPIDIMMLERTGGAIKLTWNEPLDVGGRDITGYAIKIVSINGSSANIIGYDGKGISAREGTVYDLVADTEYSMKVVAFLDISNCFDSALQAWSSVIQVATLRPTPPRTAPELITGRYTGGLIELVWTAPKDKGGIPLGGYILNLLTESAWVELFSTNNASIVSFAHYDLTESTSYQYTIMAFNAAGGSPLSEVLTSRTDSITSPSAPLNLRQLDYNSGGAISIGWDRSFDTGGQAIGGYIVYRDGILVSGVLPSSARSFTDKEKLRASTSYNYTVRTRGLNEMVSIASEQCVAKTADATRPQKVLSLSAIPGSSFLNVSWIPDGDSGGVPITAYEVKLTLGSTLVNITTVSVPSILFTGLTANSVYIGSVKVYNEVGESGQTEASMTTAAVGVPHNPDKPLVVSVSGGSFTIQVKAPVFTGGSPITNVRIYYYSPSAVTLKATLNVAAGAPTSYTFYGTNASTSYTIACSAVNSAGEGSLSETVTIQTLAISKPGQILAAPVFVNATGTTLSFEWTPPLDTGGTLDLSYDVRVVGPSIDAINPTTNLFYTVQRLAYNTLYSVSVLAKNTAGSGPWSPVRAAMTEPDAAGEFNFAQTSVSVFENATQVAFTVLRVSGLSGQITLTYVVEPTGVRPATLGSDYGVVSGSNTATGTIVFAQLQSRSSIMINIYNDIDFETPDETFAVRITLVQSASSVGKPVIGNNKMVTVTIVDDGDAGYVSFEKPVYSFPEDSRIASVTVIREYGKSTSITLGFEFWGGTATVDEDYRKTTVPVVMNNLITRATLTFSIINDRIFEYPDEYFYIRITVISGGAILRQPLTRITILDDGDVSNPGVCPPPELVSRTGGSATFATDFPNHNGSATGAISSYLVRLSTDTAFLDFAKPVAPTFSIGNLVASTYYSITIAATTTFGLGSFSNATVFSTTAATLPGPISSMNLESRSGGRISLTWSAPDDTGGVPISKYRVYVVDMSKVAKVR